MFTGLVQDLGYVTQIELKQESAVIGVKTVLAPKISLGDSVAVDGVCLTATHMNGDSFTADAMVQTLNVTSLAKMKVGSRVRSGGVSMSRYLSTFVATSSIKDRSRSMASRSLSVRSRMSHRLSLSGSSQRRLRERISEHFEREILSMSKSTSLRSMWSAS